MKELVFITVQPGERQFLAPLATQLANFRKLGYKNYHVILFTKYRTKPSMIFFKLAEEYPEYEFFFYVDERGECQHLMDAFDYVPILRPWCLREHFKLHPELKDKAIFYLDADVIFTKYLDFTPFLSDEINYLSFTGNQARTDNYLWSKYWDSKIKDVLPKRLERYKNEDILGAILPDFGLTREFVESQDPNTGGAQHLLKNIDAKFWADVQDGCMLLKTYLRTVNSRYFESENKGFQSWCADMWAVLWNLWKRGAETRTPPELDFAWATDRIEKWNNVYLYHDAGNTKDPQIVDGERHYLYNKKGRRVKIAENEYGYTTEYMDNSRVPYNDDLSFVSNKFCSYNYVQEMLKAVPAHF